MNRKQKILLLVSVILFITAGLYPNWLKKYEDYEPYRTYSEPIGRHLIFSPPPTPNSDVISFIKSRLTSFTFINITRLLIEWAIIVFPTAVLFFIFKTTEEKNKLGLSHD